MTELSFLAREWLVGQLFGDFWGMNGNRSIL
jgi:hypothetical protein